MLQGAKLAEDEGASDELVAAALLHDIGHFTSEFGTYSPDDTEDKHHDDAGAEVLAAVLPAGGDGVRAPARRGEALSLRDRPELLRKALAGLGTYAVAAGRADERGGGGGVPQEPVPRRGGAGAALGRGRQGRRAWRRAPSGTTRRCCNGWWTGISAAGQASFSDSAASAAAGTAPPASAAAVSGHRAPSSRFLAMRAVLTLSDWLPPSTCQAAESSPA